MQMHLSRSLGTHNGSFHADEVTACSLLLLFDLIDQDKIFRTRNPEILSRCDFLCDVGGVYDPESRRFDHHQADYQGPFSSAGMVLLYLKDKGWIESHLYEMYQNTLIRGVDAHDNGTVHLEPGTTSFSQVISNFLPVRYDVSEEEMDAAFFQAVDFVVSYLRRLKDRHAYALQCRSLVRKTMEEASHVLIFEETIPWIENFFEIGGAHHPAEFVIMPSGKHWKLRGIPPSLERRMEVRRPLPAKWAGLHEEALRKVSGIPGAIFCHKGRFISIWQTKQDALKALHIALQKEGH